MAVTALTLAWNTGSSFYFSIEAHVKLQNNQSVPFALSIRAIGDDNALADIALRVTDDVTGAVMGERLITDITFRYSEIKHPLNSVPIPGALVAGRMYTMTAVVQNGRLWSAPAPGTLTAGPITRKFVAPSLAGPTPTPDPDPTPTPTPTPSPSRAGAAALLIGALAAVALFSKKGRRMFK